MAMKLCDGDYIPDGWGGFQTVFGDEELLNRLLFKLTARRGGFVLMPELGSRLYQLGRVRPAEREGAARQYIAEALEGENVEIESVELLKDDGSTITLCVKCSSGSLTVSV